MIRVSVHNIGRSILAVNFCHGILLPALLAWRMQSRVYRYYDRLHEIDLLLSGKDQLPSGDSEREKLAKELDEIEAGLRAESLPLKYREITYTAAEHVQLVRSRI